MMARIALGSMTTDAGNETILVELYLLEQSQQTRVPVSHRLAEDNVQDIAYTPDFDNKTSIHKQLAEPNIGATQER